LNKKWFEDSDKFKDQLLAYHRVENYLTADTLLEYEGNAFHFRYAQGKFSIEEKATTAYQLPQIIYIPSERNFTSYLKSVKELKLTSDSLKEFIAELDNAKRDSKEDIELPINGASIQYNESTDTLYLKGKEYKIELSESASGFQSAAPLYLVSRYLSNRVRKISPANGESMSTDERERFKKSVNEIYANPDLTPEQRQAALSVLSKRFNKSAFINIVEEPEQNLFPASQWKILQSLLEYNNALPSNKLVLTTHSPYLVAFLNILIQGSLLKKKIESATQEKQHLLERLFQITPAAVLIAADALAIYQLDEKEGTIRKLPTYEGIPSDDNYHNNQLRDGNQLFDEFLTIEEELDAK
jgi:hypothetical protein